MGWLTDQRLTRLLGRGICQISKNWPRRPSRVLHRLYTGGILYTCYIWNRDWHGLSDNLFSQNHVFTVGSLLFLLVVGWLGDGAVGSGVVWWLAEDAQCWAGLRTHTALSHAWSSVANISETSLVLLWRKYGVCSISAYAWMSNIPNRCITIPHPPTPNLTCIPESFETNSRKFGNWMNYPLLRSYGVLRTGR